MPDHYTFSRGDIINFIAMSLSESRPLEVIGGEAPRPLFSVGTAIRKHFPGRGSFDGVVVEIREPYYFVRYSDGDEEELDADEVKDGVKVFCEFYPEVRECTRFFSMWLSLT